MPKSRIPSPARSEGPPVTPRRYRSRGNRSVCSPLPSTASRRLSNIVDKFKDTNRDSFAVSPLRKTILSDNTEIEMPRRKSWWRKVNNSRDVTEVLENEKPVALVNAFEELDVEVLSQEKEKKNYTIDLPESSDGESISSIVIPQRKLFTQTENVPQKKFGQVIGNRESITKHNKTNFNDKTVVAEPKNLFAQTSKRPPIFPSALLNLTPDKTVNKTKYLATEVRGPPKNLFGNRPVTKRRNMFADFIGSESEDEIPEIRPKRFAFHKENNPSRRSEASTGPRDSSPTSSITTDIEMDDWKLLPSSTMMDHHLQADDITTPRKSARLSKINYLQNETSKPRKSIHLINNIAVETPDINLVEQVEPNVIATIKNKTQILITQESEFQMEQNVDKEEVEVNVQNNKKSGHHTIEQQIEQFKVADEEQDNEDQEIEEDDNEIEASLHQPNNEKIEAVLEIIKQNEGEAVVRIQTKSIIQQEVFAKNQKDEGIPLQQHDQEGEVEIAQEGLDAFDHEEKERQQMELVKNKSVPRGLITQESEFQMEQNVDKEEVEVNVQNNKNHTIEQQTEQLKVADEEQDDEDQEIGVDGAEIEASFHQPNNEKIEAVLEIIKQNEGEAVVQNQTKSIIQQEVVKNQKDERIPLQQHDQEGEVEIAQEGLDDLDHEAKERQQMGLLKNKSVPRDLITQESEFQMEQNVDKEEIEVNVQNNKNQTIEQQTEQLEVADEERDDEDQEIEKDDEHDDAEIEASFHYEEDVDLDESEVVEDVQNESQDQENQDEGEENASDVEQDQNRNFQDEDEENTNEDEQDESIEMQADDECNANESDQDESHEMQVDDESNVNENEVVEDVQNVSQDQENQDEGEENASDVEQDQNRGFQDKDEENISEDEQDESHAMQADDESNVNESEVVEDVDNESQDQENQDEGEENASDVEQDQNRDFQDEHEENTNEDEQDEGNEMPTDDECYANESHEMQSNDESDANESDQVISKQPAPAEQKESKPHKSVTNPGNTSHDTAREQVTNTYIDPIRCNMSNEMNYFETIGRNTSVRKTKSLVKNFSIRPSMAPPRESTGFSDGTKNSSAEGSGWDSHRTTRKTLRQTFGKDFTPRKSLRALVMEKSAKRQTAINEANEKLRNPQANSTELPDNQDMDTVYDENVDPAESDHEISRRTRQTTLEMYLQKVKKENMDWNQRIKMQVENSVKTNPMRLDALNFRMPSKPTIRRAALKPLQTAPKVKRIKTSVIPLDDLPPELIVDMKYKPPKRFSPNNAAWITKRLYKFLETKLEPKYDYKARLRAEKLVEMIYNFVSDIRRVQVAPAHTVAELKREMARLDIVNTHFDFYNFFNDYLPTEVKIKVVPDIVNDIPLPREGVFAPILT